MATTAEKQALGFLVLVALAGSAVRAVGVERFAGDALRAAPAGASAELGARALAAQIAAVDSARAAPRRSRTRSRRPDSTTGARSSGGRRAPRLAKRDTFRMAEREPETLDINAASAGELERLPRVGPALAKRIIAWREQHGPFANPEQLRHVRGIGPATVRLISPLVTFSGRHRPLVSESPPFPSPSS